ncbi:uncharacterized protein BYT42DRAFT_545095 [Radiomyces spectabilis]|uniref:uncharacterized protein n=1 Tax=Radiomyces spectabilis TaxID=64574 RepID=UPI00222092AF|nr:uncharacterized protein BYT42DRAFT_545095 [Radiomyces spectabilis]KAI8381160.1 hypothetical protein BYT42DRAFT_545095 [Radiomyces spectabilis]
MYLSTPCKVVLRALWKRGPQAKKAASQIAFVRAFNTDDWSVLPGDSHKIQRFYQENLDVRNPYSICQGAAYDQCKVVQTLRSPVRIIGINPGYSLAFGTRKMANALLDDTSKPKIPPSDV